MQPRQTTTRARCQRCHEPIGRPHGSYRHGTTKHKWCRCGAPYQLGSDTSEAAADAIAPDLGKLQELVGNFIRDRGERGATDNEIQAELDLSGSTERPRRRELEQMRLIVDSGTKRRTQSGNWATVWVSM